MIAPESTIAHYRVEGLIGSGGMGEVYKAIDSRLGRAVALKILPSELSQSQERIRRFLQEAKAASSLSHPNIITVYDAGDAEVRSNGKSERIYFIATELIGGKTLRELIHHEKIPLKRIVGLLAQASDGVAKAHAAGIIHRDLKPDNIMVTEDGFAKVLDFGLAKLTEMRDDRSTEVGKTREGLILGTVAYMSPEQAQGKPADHRSDVFALGAILYEAAARRPPFSGATDPEILHRIIYEDPPPLSSVPGELDRVIVRAMAKDPDERIQSMKDLALELRDISRTYDSLKVRSGIARRRPLRWTGWMTAAVAALAGGLVVAFLLSRASNQNEPIRFGITPPEQTLFSGTPNSATALQFALSPNGRSITFVATSASGKPQLWLRELSSLEARPLDGTDGAFFPFWSPTGDAIGFFADSKLKRVSTLGGTPVVLADAPSPRGGSWSKEGVILFAPNTGAAGSLYRIPAAGGEPTAATTLDPSRREHGHRWPYFLPDGRHFLYLSISGDRIKRGIYAGELGAAETHFVTASDSKPEFAPPHDILFARKGSLYAQSVDRQLRPHDDPVLIERRIGYAPAIAYGSFSASRGDAVAYTRWVNPNRQLSWLDRGGKLLGTVFEPADWGTTTMSLQGDKAVLTRADPDAGKLDLWSIDLSRGVGSKLTTAEGDENHPVLSPDGNAIAFTSTRSGVTELFIKRLSASTEEAVPVGTTSVRPLDWTPDGRYIIFEDRTQETGQDLWLLPLDDKSHPRTFLKTRFQETDGNVSPDGRWIAYMSNDSGRDEIYVQPFPAGGDRYRVSLGGGLTPSWSADGRELFFVTPNAEIASARIKRADTRFECTVPIVLFRVPGLVAPQPTFRTAYAAAPDGRFLTVVTPTDTPSPSINVAIHWRAGTEWK